MQDESIKRFFMVCHEGVCAGSTGYRMGTGRHRYSCYHLDHRHFFIFSQGGWFLGARHTGFRTLSLCVIPGVLVGERIVSLVVGVLVVWCDIENIVLLKNPCVLALFLVTCAYSLSGVAFLVHTR